MFLSAFDGVLSGILRGSRPAFPLIRGGCMSPEVSSVPGFRTRDVRRAAPRLSSRAWPQPRTDDRWTNRARFRRDGLREAWASFLGRVPWEVFVTLTFDPARTFPVGRELASREAFWWCGFVGHVFRRPIGWAYAVERGTGGSWHAHGLFIGIGDRPWTAPTAAWRERNGHVDVQGVADSRRVALYTAKSINDDEVVLSDTLGQYRDALGEEVRISLY